LEGVQGLWELPTARGKNVRDKALKEKVQADQGTFLGWGRAGARKKLKLFSHTGEKKRRKIIRVTLGGWWDV